MKVLLVNGSPHKNGCTFTALTEVASELEKAGIETEIFQMGSSNIRGCNGCGVCGRNQNGRCVHDDDAVNALLEKAETCDGFVVGSPVYYASPNGSLLALLDRAFYAGNSFAYKPAAAVVSARRAGTTASLEVLNKYFTISNMPVVSSKYWPMVHGNCAEEAKQDLEGMQIMRTLGRNMAWLLKSIEAGRKAGIELPQPEEVNQRTNFIR
ncbi:MAG: flavodoxin family protein [Lachnospiraceae bacterium]|jgi:multimeric flavodoxin WrbA|nr:flavodoxin family protein [Lachnospiraceae bacterium]MDD3615374.1 flavodoxin family protein [Lachnospiraceae bacterium]